MDLCVNVSFCAALHMYRKLEVDDVLAQPQQGEFGKGGGEGRKFISHPGSHHSQEVVVHSLVLFSPLLIN
jgi:hypothetical protein